MNIFELSKMSDQERADFFGINSTEVKDLTYMKPLTEEELNIRRDDLAQAAMQKSVLEDELAQVKKDYKDKIDPLTKSFSENLKAIKLKATEVTGPTHKIPDYENHAMHFVAPDGTVVNSRPMLPEERQYTIMRELKQAQ